MARAGQHCQKYTRKHKSVSWERIILFYSLIESNQDVSFNASFLSKQTISRNALNISKTFSKENVGIFLINAKKEISARGNISHEKQGRSSGQF